MKTDSLIKYYSFGIYGRSGERLLRGALALPTPAGKVAKGGKYVAKYGDDALALGKKAKGKLDDALSKGKKKACACPKYSSPNPNAIDEVKELKNYKIHHFLAEKHQWNRIVKNSDDWDEISLIISKVMKKVWKNFTKRKLV
ncbi:polymorphic toxin type 35 domain-containing protein [Paludifilum halophilum]|uniref:Uncharacterized protein n=1 Tax=Paludifilum halophilum TaxID=1642702 RepID=A0A235B4Q4_9BACL|nr:polymorphic toxin type 35 domain-containing protein [Paludifilum halophilum]OYD06595.1 hypothetical protein CHM34_16005 [Paludifilum halophilum]